MLKLVWETISRERHTFGKRWYLSDLKLLTWPCPNFTLTEPPSSGLTVQGSKLLTQLWSLLMTSGSSTCNIQYIGSWRLPATSCVTVQSSSASCDSITYSSHIHDHKIHKAHSQVWGAPFSHPLSVTSFTPTPGLRGHLVPGPHCQCFWPSGHHQGTGREKENQDEVERGEGKGATDLYQGKETPLNTQQGREEEV